MTTPRRNRNHRNTSRRKARSRTKSSSSSTAIIGTVFGFTTVVLVLIILFNSGEDPEIFEDDYEETTEITETPRSTKPKPKPRKTSKEIFLEKWRPIHEAKDVKGLLSLATWCKDNGLSNKIEDLHREVLLIDPDHAATRKKLGYVKTTHGWLQETAAQQKGYVKYEKKWYTPSELKDKGLILHQGDWYTPREMREKGYTLYRNKWVPNHIAQKMAQKNTRKKPQNKKPQREKKLLPKPQKPAEIKNKVEEKVKVKEKPQPQEQSEEKPQPQRESYVYNLVEVNTPLGIWSKSEEHILARQSRRDTGMLSLKNDQDNMHLTLDSMAFGKRLFHNIGGVRTTGDNIETIMRGYTTLLQQKGYRKVKFARKGQRVGSKFGAFIRFYGTASLDNNNLIMAFNFFKYRENTYCMMISIPKSNYKKSKRNMQYLWNNIKKQ